ncbi:YbhB/YbcL family Raf kinase inhibitor-like protein [Nonomuraea sp. H19]|uniref:YbhB/YbcL family Raf kinase inhibitor-like protein n=1 Tax=Nonomuraea sp. H19 TaxID=3452206 RepID=UPI003F890BED
MAGYGVAVSGEGGQCVQRHFADAVIPVDFGSFTKHGPSRNGLRTAETRVASSGMGLCNATARVRRITVTVTVVVAAFALSGCGSLIGRSQALDIAEINVSSPELRNGKPLPREYSCQGDQGSPPLRWSSQPLSEAKSIAIVADAHSSSSSAVYWVLYNIPATTTELGPNASKDPPEGSGQARVTSGKAGYEPPCDKGNYRFTVYTLDGKVDLQKGDTLPEILKQIADQTIARGRLTAVDIQ